MHTRAPQSSALRAAAILASCWVATACGSTGGAAPALTTSLDGRPLRAPPMSDAARDVAEANLAAAEARQAENLNDLDAWIWVGRRLGYLGRYTDAIGVYTHALEHFPAEPRLLRHRGHRRLTLRQLDLAVEDLAIAAGLIEGTFDRVEQDGMPNARNQPTSTLHSNIHYHLGLALYLRGDHTRAVDVYARCRKAARNPDMLCAATYWSYLNLRKLKRHVEAAALLDPIHAGLDVIENHAYHDLLLAYRNGGVEAVVADVDPGTTDFATRGYGVAAWHLLEEEEAKGLGICQQIIIGGSWPSFGHLAAEAEFARRW